MIGSPIAQIALSALECGDEDERARVIMAIERMEHSAAILCEHATRMGRPDLAEALSLGTALSELLKRDDAPEVLRAGLEEIAKHG